MESLVPLPSEDNLSRDLASLKIDRKNPTGGTSGGSSGASSLFKWGGIGIGVAAVLFAVSQIAGKAGQTSVFKAEVSFAEVRAVSPAQAAVEVTAAGYVIPQVVAKVGARVVGRITKVNVREGARVKAGTVLFELDPADQKSALNSASARVASAQARAVAAQANLAEIQLQAERQRSLAKVGAVPSASADDLEARARSLQEQVRAQHAEATAAQAEAASLSVGLKQMSIMAPIDGVASTKPAELGEVVNPGTPLIELIDFDSLLVEVDVPEARLGKIKPEGPCEVSLEALDNKRFAGKVVEVAPRLNRSKATATVKVRFTAPPTELRPEMSARVSFLSKPVDEASLKEAEKSVVPDGTYQERSGRTVVFVVEGDKAKEVAVVLGEKTPTGKVLIEGPKPGTKLIKDPPSTLVSGQSIKERSP